VKHKCTGMGCKECIRIRRVVMLLIDFLVDVDIDVNDPEAEPPCEDRRLTALRNLILSLALIGFTLPVGLVNSKVSLYAVTGRGNSSGEGAE
jgi:hypothetical protein